MKYIDYTVQNSCENVRRESENARRDYRGRKRKFGALFRGR